MNKIYYSTFIKLKQSIDLCYSANLNLDKEFLTDSRSLLVPLHPDTVNEYGLLEFNIDLVRHYVSQWKKYSSTKHYQGIINLAKSVGALLVKYNTQQTSSHDQDALLEMNLSVEKEKPGLASKIVMYIVGVVILKAIYFGFIHKPVNIDLDNDVLKLQQQSIETRRTMDSLLR